MRTWQSKTSEAVGGEWSTTLPWALVQTTACGQASPWALSRDSLTCINRTSFASGGRESDHVEPLVLLWKATHIWQFSSGRSDFLWLLAATHFGRASSRKARKERSIASFCRTSCSFNRERIVCDYWNMGNEKKTRDRHFIPLKGWKCSYKKHSISYVHPNP